MKANRSSFSAGMRVEDWRACGRPETGATPALFGSLPDAACGSASWDVAVLDHSAEPRDAYPSRSLDKGCGGAQRRRLRPPGPANGGRSRFRSSETLDRPSAPAVSGRRPAVRSGEKPPDQRMAPHRSASTVRRKRQTPRGRDLRRRPTVHQDHRRPGAYAMKAHVPTPRRAAPDGTRRFRMDSARVAEAV